MQLPEKGRFFPVWKMGQIGDVMAGDCPACDGKNCQSKEIHKFRLQGARPSIDSEERKWTDIYFVSDNQHIADLLRNEDNLNLSNYDEALKTGGMDATFFITDRDIEKQWAVFKAALGMAPQLSRILPEDIKGEQFYDLIAEQAELAVNEAISEILSKPRPDGQVNLVTEYGYTVTYIFVRDFLGLKIPGKDLFSQANRLVNWIFVMFGNLFANPGNRLKPLSWYSNHITRKYKKEIFKSYKDAPKGSLLNRLKVLEETRLDEFDLTSEEFQEIVANIIMEVAGSFQYLTGTAFGRILQSIEEIHLENHEGTLEPISHGKLRDHVMQAKRNPKRHINEFLRRNSPTGFMLRTVGKKFEPDDLKNLPTDLQNVLPGDLLCFLNAKANRQGLKTQEKCPHYLHFGGPDSDSPSPYRPEKAHPCFGQYWARKILEKMLDGLLQFRNLRIENLGSFQESMGKPKQYLAQIDVENQNQQFVTIVSEFKNGDVLEVEKYLETWENPADETSREELQKCQSIHFMSAHVIPGGDNEKSIFRRIGERLLMISRDKPGFSDAGTINLAQPLQWKNGQWTAFQRDSRIELSADYFRRHSVGKT